MNFYQDMFNRQAAKSFHAISRALRANDDFTHQLAKVVRRNGTLTGFMGFAIAVYIMGNELDKIRLQNKIQELEERSCQCSMHHEEEK